MSAPLAYAEALAAAVRIEDNGALFYSKAAAGALDPEVAQLFSRLAAMEEDHGAYFRALALDLEQREGIFINDPEGTYAASIKVMAGSGVARFTAETAAAHGENGSAAAALEFALAAEKDSVIFYLGLQEAIADREEADKLGGIIKEELQHIAILLDLLKKKKNAQEK